MDTVTSCYLCDDSIVLENGDKSSYLDHLSMNHGIIRNVNFVVSCNFVNPNFRSNIEILLMSKIVQADNSQQLTEDTEDSPQNNDCAEELLIEDQETNAEEEAHVNDWRRRNNRQTEELLIDENQESGNIRNKRKPGTPKKQQNSKRKRKRIEKNMKQPCFDDNLYEEESEDLATNNIESNDSISTIETPSKLTKIENDEDNKQSLVSLLGQKKFSCGKCDYKAKMKHHLNQHIKSIHENVCYSCEKCGKPFRAIKDLNRHVESIHEGVRHPCSQCDYKATLKSSLKVHVKSIHEGVRHPCSQCDYKATTKSNLYSHVLKSHGRISNTGI